MRPIEFADCKERCSWRFAGSERRTGNWSTGGGIIITGERADELTQGFIETEAENFLNSIHSDSDRDAFFEALKCMGASRQQLIDLGAWPYVVESDPDHAFQELPPASRNLTNCPILRDFYFTANTPRSFSYGVALLGDGPFDATEFQEFLDKHRIAMVDLDEEVEVVIAGRTGWSEKEVDEIIDYAIGRCLRFYSQEMFLSVLAGYPDPFERFYTDRDYPDFAAYRAGHPLLKYVSRGWVGWVTAFVHPDRSHRIAQRTDHTERAEESPLHVLGYRVGRTGIPLSQRQSILDTAFKKILPNVESPEYMAEWSEPETGERLHRIAIQLVTNIQNFADRSDADNYKEAIDDWRDDLDWLEKTFYRGVHRFDWPSATIHR